eukprot:scaffold34639_cov206-Amphora_coffeaeformis.AAC.1
MQGFGSFALASSIDPKVQTFVTKGTILARTYFQMMSPRYPQHAKGRLPFVCCGSFLATFVFATVISMFVLKATHQTRVLLFVSAQKFRTIRENPPNNHRQPARISTKTYEVDDAKSLADPSSPP